MSDFASSQLQILDVFSGVGGLSLGASRAGFKVSASVEIDKLATSAHSVNFPNCKHITRNAAELRGRDIRRLTGVEKFAGLIGGPPCQGFSTIGHRKSGDTRNSLFGHFFRLVEELTPSFFVAENVLGILNEDYLTIRESAFKHVESKYTMLPPLQLVASDFGAPTYRKRAFFIGFKKDEMNPLTEQCFKPSKSIKPVFVEQALAGLPPRIFSTWQSEEQGWRKIERPGNDRFGIRLKGHVPHGVGNSEAIRRLNRENTVSGFLGTQHSAEVLFRFSNVAPGGMDSVSRFPRLDPKGFCPTIRAGTDKSRGSFQSVRPIHPKQDRVITPREAARLQGFPDWFQFSATKWHSFRQIGNSVSPLIAEFILEKIARRFSQCQRA